MGKIKMYDIAKELGLTSKEVMNIAIKLNIDVKSHLSSVSEEDAKRIKNSVKTDLPKKEEIKKEEVKKEHNKKEDRNDSPVIIRREVIIADEKQQPKEQLKKEERKYLVNKVKGKLKIGEKNKTDL